MRICPSWLLRALLGLFLASLAARPATAEAPKIDRDTDLDKYVKKADQSFAWKLLRTRDAAGVKIHDLELISQTWHGIVWKHALQVIVPAGVKPGSTLFLWNQGGKPNLNSTILALDLAKKMKAPVCFLFGIPNQPLFGGKKEDALIAETFVRFLDTKDPSWPLLFPMTKSLVRAMDALQAFAKQEWKVEVKQFVVAGASKRGWTTWLTAVVDPRVKAIIPMVIDTLNMQKQLPHQVKSYGAFSEMIRDYTARDLAPAPKTPEGQKLWQMVDPWVYRDRLTMPKLILNGTNDPYWTQDALNLYWDDLKGDKWIAYVPNAGHNLAQKNPDGTSDQDRAGNVIAAFSRAYLFDKPLPRLAWRHANLGGKARVTVESDTTPTAVRLWKASAPTLDFRKATWQSSEVVFAKGQASTLVPYPSDGHAVFFVECEFDADGLKYNLSTQLRIIGKPAKKE
jgi:PhoPQ-activated pathogenicity-related protein